MKWNFLRYLSFIVIYLNASSAFANADWFITAGAGEMFPQYHGSMTVNNNSGFSAPANEDVYTTKKRNLPLVMLAVGQRWTRDQSWIPAWALSLQYTHTFSDTIGDLVTQYSAPDFTNYKYHWNINSNTVLADAKMNLFQLGRLAPYLNAGLGLSFNSTDDYSEMALPGVTAARTSPNFQSTTKTQAAWQIGTGLDFECTRQLMLTLGYLYQSLGRFESDRGTESWDSQSLNLGPVNAGLVYLSLSYFFDKA